MKPKRLIMCRSQSEAITLRRRLNGCGIDGKLTRPPRSKKTTSCTWGIEIEAEKAQQTEQCLKSAAIAADVWCWGDTYDLSG